MPTDKTSLVEETRGNEEVINEFLWLTAHNSVKILESVRNRVFITVE